MHDRVPANRQYSTLDRLDLRSACFSVVIMWERTRLDTLPLCGGEILLFLDLDSVVVLVSQMVASLSMSWVASTGQITSFSNEAIVACFFPAILSALADASPEGIVRQVHAKRLTSSPSKYSHIIPSTRGGTANNVAILMSTRGDPNS